MENSSKPRRFKAVIGRVERIDIPQLEVYGVPAKIDTGAYRSSVWASHIQEKDGVLSFCLLDEPSPWYSGKVFTTKQYDIVDVENSFGHKQKRYSVYLKIKMGPKIVKTNVTLSDRAAKTYPILIGRKLLKGRFIVDVSEGTPLEDEETKEL